MGGELGFSLLVPSKSVAHFILIFFVKKSLSEEGEDCKYYLQRIFDFLVVAVFLLFFVLKAPMYLLCFLFLNQLRISFLDGTHHCSTICKSVVLISDNSKVLLSVKVDTETGDS